MTPTRPADARATPLNVVAIGASAGGLEALRMLLATAVPHPAIAFVVVTHLPVGHVSHLPELLGRAGALPAVAAEPGQPIEGGRLYVMPPGRLMGIDDGVIRFHEPPPRVPAPKPIDFFMAALAEDAGDRSIGIVLSGTDHDGTAGLKAIKAAGGLTLVQTPDTAEFPSMPRSAITANVADRILAPGAMPAALLEYLDLRAADGELGADTTASRPPDDASRDPLGEILEVVRERTGNDFVHYRPAMLRRRLARRMALVRCEHLADYRRLLQASPDEASSLSGEFLIGVTDFFRDAEGWQVLSDDILPALLASRRLADQPLRVWTPGCSSGEESYSIAMLLQERLEAHPDASGVQVFGTDIDLDALARARQGAYPSSIASTVSAARLDRFFERRGDRYVVRKSLRDCVTFAPQNLVRDTPFSRLDLVLCRNVIMYFEPALQERVLQLFHFALQPGGLLWLGKAESLGSHGAMFEPVERAIRVFRRVGGRAHLPGGFGGLRHAGSPSAWQRQPDARPAPTSQALHRQLGNRTVTAAVLLDRAGRVLHAQGDTGRFLLLQGDLTLDLRGLVHPALRSALRAVLRSAVERRHAVARRATLGAGAVLLDAERLEDADTTGWIVVTFKAVAIDAAADPRSDAADDPAAAADADALDQAVGHDDHDDEGEGPADLDPDAGAGANSLYRELEESRRELALALDDAEQGNEELRLAGEEATALNEELQSANEELESSKEELQSLNEELATVNAQLEDRVVEVARQAEDLSNLLASTHIATVLLDRSFRVRRFTPAAARLFTLRAGDEGRLLSDLSSSVDDPRFAADAAAVLAGSPAREAELVDDAGHILLRRVQPFLTEGGDTDGIVATYVDITTLRASTRQSRHLMSLLEDSNDAVMTFEADGRLLSWNKGAERLYGYQREEALKSSLFDLVPEAARPAARALIAGALRDGAAGPQDADRLTSDGRAVRVSSALSALRDDAGRAYALLTTDRDLTERLRLESEIRFRRLSDDIPALLRVEDALGDVQFVNRCCVEFTGRPREVLLGRGWLHFVHPDDRQRCEDEQAAARAAQARHEGDVRLRRHDGVYRWMRTVSVPHLDEGGAFAGYVALMLDEEDRKVAEAELVGADRRKDEFLAMLAHELRNPLAPISNAVALLTRSASGEPTTAWAVGVIQHQTDLLAKLLDGLLDVARIARGKTVLDLAPVEIQVVLERAIELGRPSIDARRQTLTIHAPQGPILVEGDLMRLVQVFGNLLNNASKYTQPEGAILVDVERVGSDVEVRVSDNGAGIEAAMLPRVFDLFAQADSTLDRAKGGLGLGLTLVRQLVELHRGSVLAASAGLDRGSTFTVRLPCLHTPDKPADTPLPVSTPSRNPRVTARHVLVVDDNVEGAQTLAHLLRWEGHRVEVAHDGHEALALADRDPPEVVLLDIGLPGLDGYQVARRLRGRAATAKTLLIALTGYGRPQDVASATGAGFDLHLVKPVDVAALLDAIAAAPSRSDGH